MSRATCAADIIQALGGDAKSGKAKCPCHDDKTPSLSVNDAPDGTVLVHCHASCPQDRVIDKLRDLDLWPPRTTRTTRRHLSNPPAHASTDTRAIADAILAAAAQSSELPDAYLRGRGIEIVPDRARVIASAASAKLTGLRYSAMVLPITNVTDVTQPAATTGAHLTFLTKDARQNATGKDGKIRRTYGELAGGFVSLIDPNPDLPLIVAEGVETALAAAQIAGLPAIATLGAANLVKVHPPAASEIIIASDNDEPGRKAAVALADRLATSGAKVRVAVPPEGNGDWNDALRSGLDLDALKSTLRNAPIMEPSVDPPRALTGISPDILAQIAKLAKLDVVSYEQSRTAAAKELSIRAPVLDKLVGELREPAPASQANADFQPIEPWAEPVDGAELLDDLWDTFARHLVMSKATTTACVLWTMFAWAHDAGTHSPILMITAPTHGCGKTTLVDLLLDLVPRPLQAANTTSAAIFRSVEKYRPTMLLDEADAFLRSKPEIRSVLDSGHERKMAFVLRCVGDDFEVKRFSTWCAKVISGIGRQHATLEDRSIKIVLKRKLATEKVERLPNSDDPFYEMKRRAMRWVADNFEALKQADPVLPEELFNRVYDNWRPLVAIADLAGGDWPEEARSAALRLSKVDDDETWGILLLRDLFDLFEEETERDRKNLSSVSIVTKLEQMEDRPWPEFSRGKPISAHGVARLLKPFGIGPRPVVVYGGSHKQGYRPEEFKESWSRYAPDLPELGAREAPNSPNLEKKSNG